MVEPIPSGESGRAHRSMMHEAGQRFLHSTRTLLQDRTLLLKAASFACVGAVNTLVDFGVFSLAYLYIGLPIVVANILSWSVAVSGSYVMNSLITFAVESQRKLQMGAYLGFIGSQLGGLVANTATVVAASYVVPVLVAKALAIGVSFLVNFSLAHFVLFRGRSHPSLQRVSPAPGACAPGAQAPEPGSGWGEADKRQ